MRTIFSFLNARRNDTILLSCIECWIFAFQYCMPWPVWYRLFLVKFEFRNQRTNDVSKYALLNSSFETSNSSSRYPEEDAKSWNGCERCRVSYCQVFIAIQFAIRGCPGTKTQWFFDPRHSYLCGLNNWSYPSSSEHLNICWTSRCLVDYRIYSLYPKVFLASRLPTLVCKRL